MVASLKNSLISPGLTTLVMLVPSPTKLLAVTFPENIPSLLVSEAPPAPSTVSCSVSFSKVIEALVSLVLGSIKSIWLDKVLI